MKNGKILTTGGMILLFMVCGLFISCPLDLGSIENAAQEEGNYGGAAEKTVTTNIIRPIKTGGISYFRYISGKNMVDDKFIFFRNMNDDEIFIADMQTTNGYDTGTVRFRGKPKSNGTVNYDARIQECTSLDKETTHSGEVVAGLTAKKGNLYDCFGNLIGRAGSVNISLNKDKKWEDQWKTVNYGSSFTDPVVFVTLASYEGSDPCHVRIRNVSSASFKVKLEEWTYQDDNHSKETVNWLVLEKGIHTLGDVDGEVWPYTIEVGTKDLLQDEAGKFYKVNLKLILPEKGR